MSKVIANMSLVKTAAAFDHEFRSHWKTTKSNIRILGELCLKCKREELHKYIAKPGSRKGYPSLTEYVMDVTQGELQHTRMYMAMAIAELTQGEHALQPAVVDNLSTCNSYELSKVPAPKRHKMVAKAQEQSKNKFKTTVQSVRNEDKPVAKQKIALVDFFEKWPPQLVDDFEDLISDLCLLPAVEDGDLDVPKRFKAIKVMLVTSRQYCQEEINAARKRISDGLPVLSENSESKETAETAPAKSKANRKNGAEAFNAADAADVIAKAETERRVVHRKGEARPN